MGNKDKSRNTSKHNNRNETPQEIMTDEIIQDMMQEEISEENELMNEIDVAEEMGIEWIECEEKFHEKKRNKITGYDIFRYMVMLMALIIFGYASYELTLIFVESKEATDLKSSTSNIFLVNIDDLREDGEQATNSEGEFVDLQNKGDGTVFVFDYETMLGINSDAKGYIRQDNGEYIDNPILQTTDNDYYLNHLVDHSKNKVGSLFIDYNIADGLEAKNCIIYGHNMGERAGRIMFGSLNWYYHKTGYYKEHPTFDIWVGDTHYRYYVFAIYKTDAVGSSVYTYDFASDEEFMAYIESSKKQSKYKFPDAPEITKDSKIVTLSTCTHTDEMRMIVQAVRGEEIDVYGNVVSEEKK